MKYLKIIALVLLATFCSCNDKRQKESIQTSSITEKVEDDSLVNEIDQDGEAKGGSTPSDLPTFRIRIGWTMIIFVVCGVTLMIITTGRLRTRI